MSDDLCRKKADRKRRKTRADAAPPVASSDGLEGLSHDALYAKIFHLAEGGNGLFWLRRVIEVGGGDPEKFTPEFMIGVLRNPEDYYPKYE